MAEDSGECRRDTNSELDVKGPGGIRLSFKGSQVFPVLVMIITLMSIGYFLYLHDTKEESHNAVTTAAITKMAQSIDKADATQRAMIYVLALPQNEREKLNLMKPKELQDMQR